MTTTVHSRPAVPTFRILRSASLDSGPQPRFAAFTLMRVDSDRMRAFDTARRGLVVAGMLRHALRLAAERAGWSEQRILRTVLGHGEGGEPRVLLVPVPSIEWRHGAREVVTGVRRVALLSTASRPEDILWAQRSLGGAELIDEHSHAPIAVLAAAAPDDRAFERYRDAAASWVTVTPLVLPGYDDPGGLRARLRQSTSAAERTQLLERLSRRREALVRKALRHGGLPDALVLGARIETQEVGFFAGVESASRHVVPRHLQGFARLHVRLTWPVPVAGPLCLGRGRFSGLGLFASQG